MRINACFTKVLGSKIYFFVGSRYYRYDIDSDQTDEGYPLDISGHWPGLWPDKIDAAVNLDIDQVYFFQGAEYALYSLGADKVVPGYPRPIKGNLKGVWADGIEAAVNWNNGKLYFFKGSEYIRYDIAADRADSGYPAAIADFWKGLWKEGIDAAFNYNNKKAYFFKGDEYIRYDVKDDRADDGYPLPISQFWPGLAPLEATTDFHPARHGFNFPNSFEINPAMFGAANLNKWNMGLCGGMCSAALDHFLKGTPIPTLDHPPAQKCPELGLFYELFGRQMITLYPANWLRVLSWQITPEADTQVTHFTPSGTGSFGMGISVATDDSHGIGFLTTRKECPKMMGIVASGKPAILCLIRQRGDENPSDNHQVLAIGYRLVDTGHLKIQIYDPNHPDTTQELTLELLNKDHSINGTETDGKKFRGFFVN